MAVKRILLLVVFLAVGLVGGVSANTSYLSDYDSNLVLHLGMDGVNGQATFYDSSPKFHSMTASSASVSTSTYLFGTGAGYFNTGYLSTPSSTDFNLGSTFTIHAQVKKDSAGMKILASRVSGTYNGYQLGVYDDHVGFTGHSGGYVTALKNTTINPGTWYQIDIIGDGGTVTVYVDGSAGDPVSVPIGASTGTQYIGVDWDGSSSKWAGYIDDFTIWKGVAIPIASLYPQNYTIGALTDAPSYGTWYNASGALPPREGASVASLEGYHWQFGGRSFEPGITPHNTVYRSSDGISWVQMADAPWTPRDYIAAASNDSTILIACGYDGSSNQKDVYQATYNATSEDLDWSLVNANPSFGTRHAAGLVWYDSKWFLLGGIGYHDVWSSPDGNTWTQLTNTAPFPAQTWGGTVVFDGYIYVINGKNSETYPSGFPPSVYRSTDGATWSLVTYGPWGGRYVSPIIVDTDNNALVILGGGYWTAGSSGSYTDIWSSYDGAHWQQSQSEAPFGDTVGCPAAFFNNHIFIVGCPGTGDVWNTYGDASLVPVADFTATPTSGTSPLVVAFTDSSTGTPTAWGWYHDNGGGLTLISASQNPTYEFSAPGTYAIRLIASNTYGSDVETKEDYITVSAAPTPTATATATPTASNPGIILRQKASATLEPVNEAPYNSLLAAFGGNNSTHTGGLDLASASGASFGVYADAVGAELASVIIFGLAYIMMFFLQRSLLVPGVMGILWGGFLLWRMPAPYESVAGVCIVMAITAVIYQLYKDYR